MAARALLRAMAFLAGPLTALVLCGSVASANAPNPTSLAADAVALQRSQAFVDAGAARSVLAAARPAGEKKRSNEVEVEATVESFTILKEQKLASQSSYTTEQLSAKVGETVDYRIEVTNTGTVKLSFSALSDAKCTNIQPAGATELEAGASEFFTCEHTFTKADLEANGGIYENVALIVGNEKEQGSPPVKTRVEEENFEIVKEQKLAGETAFTTKTLAGEVGRTVDYKITVTNTGSVKLVFGTLNDPKCTNIQPAGATELERGKSESFTCEHTLAVTDKPDYSNVASIEGNKLLKESNKVTVTVAEAKQAVKAACTISESSIVLHGASGSKRKPFTVRISSLGISEITFYLDGRKLRTLKASQAKHGEFAIQINPNKLSYGAHRVKITTVMDDTVCAPIARESTFVRPRPAKVVPKFTG